MCACVGGEKEREKRKREREKREREKREKRERERETDSTHSRRFGSCKKTQEKKEGVCDGRIRLDHCEVKWRSSCLLFVSLPAVGVGWTTTTTTTATNKRLPEHYIFSSLCLACKEENCQRTNERTHPWSFRSWYRYRKKEEEKLKTKVRTRLFPSFFLSFRLPFSAVCCCFPSNEWEREKERGEKEREREREKERERREIGAFVRSDKEKEKRFFSSPDEIAPPKKHCFVFAFSSIVVSFFFTSAESSSERRKERRRGGLRSWSLLYERTKAKGERNKERKRKRGKIKRERERTKEGKERERKRTTATLRIESTQKGERNIRSEPTPLLKRERERKKEGKSKRERKKEGKSSQAEAATASWRRSVYAHNFRSSGEREKRKKGNQQTKEEEERETVLILLRQSLFFASWKEEEEEEKLFFFAAAAALTTQLAAALSPLPAFHLFFLSSSSVLLTQKNDYDRLRRGRQLVFAWGRRKSKVSSFCMTFFPGLKLQEERRKRKKERANLGVCAWSIQIEIYRSLTEKEERKKISRLHTRDDRASERACERATLERKREEGESKVFLFLPTAKDCKTKEGRRVCERKREKEKGLPSELGLWVDINVRTESSWRRRKERRAWLLCKRTKDTNHQKGGMKAAF